MGSQEVADISFRSSMSHLADTCFFDGLYLQTDGPMIHTPPSKQRLPRGCGVERWSPGHRSYRLTSVAEFQGSLAERFGNQCNWTVKKSGPQTMGQEPKWAAIQLAVRHDMIMQVTLDTLNTEHSGHSEHSGHYELGLGD